MRAIVSSDDTAALSLHKKVRIFDLNSKSHDIDGACSKSGSALPKRKAASQTIGGRSMMAEKRRALAPAMILLALIVWVTVAPAREIRLPASKWSATDPPIDLTHIESGEINRRGEAVGYHHRPNGTDPPGAKVLRITRSADANGVYRARVALRDPATGEWIDKRASSTFFPDAMSDAQVIQAVLAAFHNATRHRGGEFIGDSGHGFMIAGWYHAGRIVAAYPVQPP